MTQLLSLMMWSHSSLQLYLRGDSVSLTVRESRCNWRRLTRKSLAGCAEQSKTLDNIPASCLKINNPDPGGERTRDRPHTAVSFFPSTPPQIPRSSLPPHYARNSALCVQCWAEHPPYLYLASNFFDSQFISFLFSLTALFSKLGCRSTVKDAGKKL